MEHKRKCFLGHRPDRDRPRAVKGFKDKGEMKEGGGGEMTDVDLDLDLESKEATQLSVRQSVRTNSSR